MAPGNLICVFHRYLSYPLFLQLSRWRVWHCVPSLQNTKYYLLKVCCGELIFLHGNFSIFFFILNRTWQDFSFQVKQHQSYRTADVFPHVEIDKLELLDRFMNPGNSKPHSSQWLFFSLISRAHLGTLFWQWSSTAIGEMETSQNFQAHINFIYFACCFVFCFPKSMRNMTSPVYISKYTPFFVYQ